MSIGDKLIKLRGDRTADEIAKAVNVTPQAISNYENNVRVPRDTIKQKLANYFGVSVESIFFDEKSNK